MAIMVASFRVSVDDWLTQLLAADVYVRTLSGGETGTLTPDEQLAIARTEGIMRVDFLRSSSLTLDAGRPDVALIARGIDVADPAKLVPIISDTLSPAAIPERVLPIWVSEAMVDLYGYRLGQQVTLPLTGRQIPAIVAGIWRDYARQSGSIQMRLVDYQALTGDRDVTDAGLWLRDGATVEQVMDRLKQLPFGGVLEFAQPNQIRAISLQIFDRSFAVTYLLELVAIVIGLFGVAATFSAQTLARAKEFGMLRHIGVTRRQILAVLALEGSLLTAAGIVVGFVLGWAISLILVFIVNPQSFHWTMQLHMPWGLLCSVAAMLLLAAGVTALTSGRLAISGDAVKAVREDW